MPDDLALGTRVEFDWPPLERRTADQGDSRKWEKQWIDPLDEPAGWVTQYRARRPESREGIVVGIRHLQNGYVSGGYWDAPATWHCTETVKAYLIAYDIRRDPVYVLPERVRPQLTRAPSSASCAVCGDPVTEEDRVTPGPQGARELGGTLFCSFDCFLRGATHHD